ncbi:hypothetical protein K435DRAFT_808045 [Dendrothele bispora CBS 962.96]|uniref:Uncharacterized protein n=1 Tax=Dendrothele bispora (strain CBS 962.96) TaxID=1314807 RepID=A0A4V4HCB8_DENBC|nr:hypothetical protein K435DRAFT_808045 [Dendrothele bispora CBS 962.96]
MEGFFKCRRPSEMQDKELVPLEFRDIAKEKEKTVTFSAAKIRHDGMSRRTLFVVIEIRKLVTTFDSATTSSGLGTPNKHQSRYSLGRESRTATRLTRPTDGVLPHHPTKALSLTSLHPKVTPEVVHPFPNAPLKLNPLTFGPTSTTTHRTETTDDSPPDEMPFQDFAAGKTDEQLFEEVMDLLESLWNVWVALKECWIRLMVLMSNNVGAVDGEGNGDGAGN